MKEILNKLFARESELMDELKDMTCIEDRMLVGSELTTVRQKICELSGL